MNTRDESNRLELALQSSRLGLWDWNMITGQTVFNERWAEIIGYRLEELEPTTIDTWMEHAVAEDLEKSNEAISAHVRGETSHYDIDVRMKHRAGHVVWVHDRGRVVERDADGSPVRMVGTHEDITARIERELALEEAQIVFDNSLEGIVLLDADEIVTSINSAFTVLTGWSSSDIVGRSFDAIRSHSNHPEETRRLRAAARTDAGVRIRRDFFRPDGSRIPMLMSINRVLGPDGDVIRLVAQVSDLSQQVQDEATRLEQALTRDETTDLHNARGLSQLLAQRAAGPPDFTGGLGLILVGMSDLNSIQEAFGHQGTEKVVATIAHRLQDFVTPDLQLARIGIDQFALVVAETKSRDQIRDLAEKIRDSVTGSYQISGLGKLYLTCSIGIAIGSETTEPVDELIRRANSALNRALDGGPGALEFHDSDRISEKRDQLSLIADMRDAWQLGEFRLAYQPMTDVKSGRLVGVEALMRWESARHGSVPPQEFISLAEQHGLISEMGAWAIREALNECARFREAGVDIDVAVNVSAQQLNHENFAESITSALEDAGVSASALILELTESTFLHASPSTLQSLARLSDLGVRWSLDDFGTGYSSFAYLNQFSLDRLKIDKSFVDDLANNPKARSIVRAMINLGHNLDMRVIAEGVETEQQLEALRELECDYFQGFLKSRAVTPSSVIEMAHST